LHVLVLPLFLFACHAEALAKAGAHARNRNHKISKRSPLNLEFTFTLNSKLNTSAS
jgi:hypothetical protein